MDLYEDRKIAQHGSADKVIDGLTAKDNKKGLKEYEKAIAKAEGKERLSEKQQEALKMAREGKKVAKAGRIIRRKDSAENAGWKNTESSEGTTEQKGILYQVHPFLTEKLEKGKSGVKKNDVMYYPLLNPVERRANVKSNEFIETIPRRMNTERERERERWYFFVQEGAEDLRDWWRICQISEWR